MNLKKKLELKDFMKNWKIWPSRKKEKLLKVKTKTNYRQPNGYQEPSLTQDGHRLTWRKRDGKVGTSL